MEEETSADKAGLRLGACVTSLSQMFAKLLARGAIAYIRMFSSCLPGRGCAPEVNEDRKLWYAASFTVHRTLEIFFTDR